MPPALFELVALLIAVFGVITAAFPRHVSQWQMRGPDGTTRIEPSPMHLLMMRVMGLVVAGIALLMAFGSPEMSL